MLPTGPLSLIFFLPFYENCEKDVWQRSNKEVKSNQDHVFLTAAARVARDSETERRLAGCRCGFFRPVEQDNGWFLLSSQARVV